MLVNIVNYLEVEATRAVLQPSKKKILITTRGAPQLYNQTSPIMLISSPLFSIRLSEQSATPPLRPWAVTPPAQCLPGCAWYRTAASAAGSLWLQLVTGHRGIRMWSGQGSWECEYLLSYYTITNWWCPLVFQDAFPRCDSILTAFALTLVLKPEIEIGS